GGFRQVRDAADRSGCGDQHNSGLPPLAFHDGQHRVGTRAAWNGNTDIQALCDRDREAAPGNRRDLEAVYRDQLTIELSQINVVGAHRGAIDDAQENPSARLDLDALG